jgi:carboxyl-terminal processing protease
MKGSRFVVFALVGFVSFLSGGWLLQRGAATSGNVYESARLFEDVLAHVAEYAVDTVDEQQLYDMAIDGLLEQLNDPYASFLRPNDVSQLRERTSGTYGGLGMQIDVRDGWITVIAPMADTPAEEAGIESGDRIVEVEGESTFGWKSEKAVIELRGEPGTEINISIARPGVPEPFDLTLTRATINIKSVQASMMLSDDVGYMSLAFSTIGENTVSEVKQQVIELRQDGARSLILDLRDNPGGLLDDGIALADLFLDRDLVVADTRGRTPQATETYRTSHDQDWPEMSIVVLVNGGTASAAEIIAGALQDHDRALVLGTPTFGKGLVQTVYPLGPDQALQITTGRWFTPSGRTIQRPVRRIGASLRIVGGLEEELRDRSGDTTVTEKSTVFYTDAGRPVVGGGGIRPDVSVRLDTLLDGERAFWSSLGAQIPEYRGTVTSYALDIKASGNVTDPDFHLTDEMRAELRRRLKQRVDISDQALEGGGRLMDRQLEYEVTRYVFGRDAETARRTRNDVQVRVALSLLKGAPSTQELLARGQKEQESRSEDPNR